MESLLRKQCKVEGCQKHSRRWGLCGTHSWRLATYGDPLRGPLTIEERFWAKVEKGPGCWLWTATINAGGYGEFKYRGTMEKAHRVGYVLTHGPIPNGMHVCHSCDVRNCVNPAHLWVGTRSDNMRDAFAKGRKVVPYPDNRGERSARAKLTEQDVRDIRERYALGGRTQAEIGEEYGVGPSVISRVVTGKSWGHVP